MEKKSNTRLDEVNMGIKNGSYPEKLLKTKKKPNLLAIFLFLVVLLLAVYITYNSLGMGNLFDENLTHRSCDFLSIEGFPTLVRCSDGTYWDANKHNNGQTSNIGEITPVMLETPLAVESTPPPFLCLTEDILRL
jgi:hypothetical protein